MRSFFWFNYIISVLRKYLKRVLILGDFIKIELESLEKLNIVLNFLKNHSKTKFNLLVDIACVDFLNFKDNRFQMNYLLLSCFHNSRLTVSFWLNEKDVIQSSTNIFSGANWLEREVWDMYGIFFYNHSDLRRILTDYGFSGYPFRKDFPLNGFFEIRYDENKQYLVYEPVELTQTFRFYDFLNPFHKKYIF
jgi:NADH/F420H2 dehydrogenase subunit C